MIKHRKFSEALLAVAAVGGVVSLIWGMTLVDASHDLGRLSSAIMIAAGLLTDNLRFVQKGLEQE